jgi:hypothetical protein
VLGVEGGKLFYAPGGGEIALGEEEQQGPVVIVFAWIVDNDNDNENDNRIEISSTVCSSFAE